MSEHKTVRVRIAVMVTELGEYEAVAWSDSKDSDMVESISERFLEWAEGQQIAVHYVEADVPLPVAQTIEGVVEEADDE